VGANGYTEEEMKVTNETRKILGIPDLPVACTAVRVPVFAGHSESVMVELCSDPEPDQVKEALGHFPGMCVLDDPARGVYPMPKDCVEREEVFVGRIRKDLSAGKSYNLWIVADNVWKGAALNAVQILELLLSR
jgi:aspartate-semialdehyde dehydrogenase